MTYTATYVHKDNMLIFTLMLETYNRGPNSESSDSIMAAPSPQYSPFTRSLIQISIYPSIFTHRQQTSSFANSTLFRYHGPPSISCCSAGCDNEKGRLRRFDKQLEHSPKRRSNVKYVSLFGRRKLWRRVFFESKKVRNILLLNVITFVCGKSDFLYSFTLFNSLEIYDGLIGPA